MPVKVSCHCGQSFTAKDELVGQTLLCPKCSAPLTIGAPRQVAAGASRKAGLDDLFDEVGIKEVRGPRCPSCGAGMKPNAVICLECGYNTKTGTKVAAALAAGQRGGGHGGHGIAADAMLERAAQALEQDKVEHKKNRSQGAPWYVYFAGLTLAVGFAVGMVMIPQKTAFLVLGASIIGLAGIAQFYFYIRMLIVAFSESAACGLMFMFVPFYGLYYIITRWSDVGPFFMMQLMASFIQGFGMLVIFVGPYLAVSEDGEEDVRRTPAALQVAEVHGRMPAACPAAVDCVAS